MVITWNTLLTIIITINHHYLLPDNVLSDGLRVHSLGPVDGHHQGCEATVVHDVDTCPSL